MKTQQSRGGHPVVRTNPKTGAQKMFLNARSAVNSLKGGDISCIHHACEKVLKTYRGFEWSYYPPGVKLKEGPFRGHTHSDKTKQQMSEAKDAKKRPVLQMAADGTVVKRFASLCEAARAGFGNRSNIISVCKGKEKVKGKKSQRRLTAYGFRWAYATY